MIKTFKSSQDEYISISNHDMMKTFKLSQDEYISQLNQDMMKTIKSHKKSLRLKNQHPSLCWTLKINIIT